jgi:hypothetical protein
VGLKGRNPVLSLFRVTSFSMDSNEYLQSLPEEAIKELLQLASDAKTTSYFAGVASNSCCSLFTHK